MGFWDSVAGLAKGAGQAVQEKAKEQQQQERIKTRNEMNSMVEYEMDSIRQ